MSHRPAPVAAALAFALLLAAPAATAEQPPEALIEAMEIDATLLVAGSVDTAGSSATMFDALSTLGVISPTNAPTLALMSTGDVNTMTAMQDYDYPGAGPDTSAGDHATLAFDLEVPAWANSFSFDFFFLSREYPEWVGGAYADTFEVNLDSAAYTGQVVFDAFGNPVTVNSALFAVVDPAQLVGTGFDADGGTGWTMTTVPCVGGDTIGLSFEVYDVADGVWDSAVLLDGFAFSTDPAPDGPWTGEPSDDDDAGDDDDVTDDDDVADDDDSGDDDDAGDDDSSDDDDDAGAPCTVPPLAEGVLETAGGSVFDVEGIEVAATVEHNQDIDADDGGCLVRVVLQVGGGGGCGLTVQFELDGERLILTDLTLDAGSFCPGWTDQEEGTYVLDGGEVVLGGTTSTPDYAASWSCIENASLEPSGTATLGRIGDGAMLELPLDGFRVVGDLVSLGVDGFVCPDAVTEGPPSEGGGSGGRSGCSCSSGGIAGASWLAMGLLALGLRRRTGA